MPRSPCRCASTRMATRATGTVTSRCAAASTTAGARRPIRTTSRRRRCATFASVAMVASVLRRRRIAARPAIQTIMRALPTARDPATRPEPTPSAWRAPRKGCRRPRRTIGRSSPAESRRSYITRPPAARAFPPPCSLAHVGGARSCRLRTAPTAQRPAIVRA